MGPETSRWKNSSKDNSILLKCMHCEILNSDPIASHREAIGELLLTIENDRIAIDSADSDTIFFYGHCFGIHAFFD